MKHYLDAFNKNNPYRSDRSFIIKQALSLIKSKVSDDEFRLYRKTINDDFSLIVRANYYRELYGFVMKIRLKSLGRY